MQNNHLSFVSYPDYLSVKTIVTLEPLAGYEDSWEGVYVKSSNTFNNMPYWQNHTGDGSWTIYYCGLSKWALSSHDSAGISLDPEALSFIEVSGLLGTYSNSFIEGSVEVLSGAANVIMAADSPTPSPNLAGTYVYQGQFNGSWSYFKASIERFGEVYLYGDGDNNWIMASSFHMPLDPPATDYFQCTPGEMFFFQGEYIGNGSWTGKLIAAFDFDNRTTPASSNSSTSTSSVTIPQCSPIYPSVHCKIANNYVNAYSVLINGAILPAITACTQVGVEKYLKNATCTKIN